MLETTVSHFHIHQKEKSQKDSAKVAWLLFANVSINGLTHSCLEISLTIVVWNCDTFENNFEIKHILEEYLKGSCLLVSGLQFPFKYFVKITFV